MSKDKDRDVASSDPVMADQQGSDANHHIATLLARRERALTIKHEMTGTTDMSWADQFALRTEGKVLDLERWLAGLAGDAEELDVLSDYAAVFSKATSELLVEPVGTQKKYLDSVEVEAYYRFRTMLDADQVVRQMRGKNK